MEKSPRYDTHEPESELLEYTLDPSTYVHMREDAAKTRAEQTGLEVVIVKRNDIALGEPVGYDLRRLNLSVRDGFITQAKLG